MDPTIYSPIRIVMPDGAPKIVRREQLPDQRKIVIVPLRAAKDQRIRLQQLRVLIIACSYCNRGGFFWASQKRLAQDLGISQQAVSYHMLKLQKLGYVRTVRKGFAGERADTKQVIFKEGLTVSETVKISESPAPYMVEQAAKQAKRRGRPKKVKEGLEQTQSCDKAIGLVQSIEIDNRLITLRNKVSEKIWQLAINRCDNPDDYQSMLATINKLLR